MKLVITQNPYGTAYGRRFCGSVIERFYELCNMSRAPGYLDYAQRIPHDNPPELKRVPW